MFANIGVKGRGHTDHWLGGQHQREGNYVYCTKQKHFGQPDIFCACIRFPWFCTRLSLPVPLSPSIMLCFFMLASLHAYMPVPSRHTGWGKGSLSLPSSQWTGGALYTVSYYCMRLFLFTNKAHVLRCRTRLCFKT